MEIIEFLFYLFLVVEAVQPVESNASSTIDRSSRQVEASITPTLARSYMEGFTIHGLSKVFTGKLWERLYWFLILTGALAFVLYKVYGFHETYVANEFRTEIRMVDAKNLIYPELEFCRKISQILLVHTVTRTKQA